MLSPAETEVGLDDDIAALSEKMEIFVQELDQKVDVERRDSERHTLKAHVPVVPVNEKIQPVGPGMLLFSRNISTSGVAFIHTEPLEFSHLVAVLRGAEGEQIQVLMEVVRCAARGDSFEIACRYLRRLPLDPPSPTNDAIRHRFHGELDPLSSM